MLESLLIGLLTSGVYYVAQQHKDWIKGKAAAKELEKDAIRKSLENGFKSLFPAIEKQIRQFRDVDDKQIKALNELFYRVDDDLELTLKQMIDRELYQQYQENGTNDVDLFSVGEFAQTLRKLRDDKRLNSLTDETINQVVPRLVVLMLQAIMAHPELGPIYEIMKDLQAARFQKELLNHIRLTDEQLLGAVNDCRQTLYNGAYAAYQTKLSGAWNELDDHFTYMSPGLRLVRRGEDGIYPDQFEDEAYGQTISHAKFVALLKSQKKILAIAGAGVGKTTFLRHLHLELLRERIKEAPLPVFNDVSEFLESGTALGDKITGLLCNSQVIACDEKKAKQIAVALNKAGRLCFLLDAMDQASSTDNSKIQKYFKEESVARLGNNIVVVACRSEQVRSYLENYRRLFHSFEWVVLEKFSEKQLEQYLADDVLDWLDYDNRPEPFKELLQTGFYANIAKGLGCQDDRAGLVIKNLADLLGQFMKELFLQARNGRADIPTQKETRFLNVLYRLGLDTFTRGHKQVFPESDLEDYDAGTQGILDTIFETHWISRHIFEGEKEKKKKEEKQYTFYHQLLQEYFAARRLAQLFQDDKDEFEAALVQLEFSKVLLDLVDQLTPDAAVFEYCQSRIKAALAWSDHNKRGIESSGHKFTWLLAFRDIKATRPRLKERLQKEFDEEVAKSQAEAKNDCKWVVIPAGAFLMGGYDYTDEQPVRVVYLSEYWISRYAETFEEYDAYCEQSGKEKPEDRRWGRLRRPVIYVSLDEAKEYAAWLGRPYHLPTEAQWEKAARGRLGRQYPWGNEYDKTKGNFGSGQSGTVDVDDAHYRGYMYGIHQMAGNVWEWCDDWWSDGYEEHKVTNPNRKLYCSSRVLRGGCWYHSQWHIQCANRLRNEPLARRGHLGFRLVRKK